MLKTLSRTTCALIGILLPGAAHAAQEDVNIWLAQTAQADLGGLVGAVALSPGTLYQ